MEKNLICKRCKHLKKKHSEYEIAGLVESNKLKEKQRQFTWECNEDDCGCICHEQDFESVSD